MQSQAIASGHAPVNGISMYYEVHGRTTDRDAPVSFESSADDVAGLLLYLDIAQADIFGFSNGPSIALQVAICHPLETMHDKDAARMWNFEGLPDAVVGCVSVPTLIVVGDRDIVTIEHVVELSRLIPSTRLVVLPGRHGDYLGEAMMSQGESRYPALIAALIEVFVDSR